MSDEQERRPGPDETRQFSPFGGDDEPGSGSSAPGNHPDGGPRSGDDRTQPSPRGGAGDETVVTPGPPRRDSTSILPRGSQAWNAPSGGGAAWAAGRAEVRAPQPGGGQGDFTRTEWIDAPPAEPRGRWWMPIVVGIVALILLAVLGWGIYLIVQNSGGAEPAPGATTSAPGQPATTGPETTAPTTAPEATTPAPTTPTTTEPTTTTPTTEPAEVTVPALKGLSREEAEQALDRRGLTWREIFRSGDAAAGTVIDSDPSEGQQVPPDTQVTLVIAAERTAPPTTTAGTAAGD